MREADISRKALIQKISDFLEKVLPGNKPIGTVPVKIETPDGFTAHLSPTIQTDTDPVWE